LSEPLIVDGPQDGPFTVLEGNRRLASLLLLGSGEWREGLREQATWDELAGRAQLPQAVNVVVANRDEVVPVLGFRHIAGIEAWRPYPKARYIAKLIEGAGGRSFEDVAQLVGDEERKVREAYRNFKIVEAARASDLDTTILVAKRFGVFTRAMQSPRILRYIGAPGAWDVAINEAPIPRDNIGQLRYLLYWLTGNEEHEPAVRDSRQLTALAAVLDSQTGVRHLIETNDLATALELTSAPLLALQRLLQKAIVALEAAANQLPPFAQDQDVSRLVQRCEAAVGRLRPPRG
jgi:hypothetical protein